jgi:hypothetical protein
MKRALVIVIATLVTLVIFASIALAAKPLDVIYHSNGFPSGQHFNLNLHGKDPATYTGSPSGQSVVIGLSGNSTIEYLSNKKNKNATELVVLDPLTEAFDDDAAQVYLPYNIVDQSDNVTKQAEGYFVFGRSLGKPNNGSNGDPSTILTYPNFVVASDNHTDNTTYGWPFDPDVDMIDLGMITSQGNMYKSTPEGYVKFERFDPDISSDPNQKGKGNKTGKSMGTEITGLFWWSGYVSDNATLDLNGNGYFDVGDIPADQDGDLDIDEDDLLLWLAYLESIGEAIFYEPIWIFDIADMVISGQTFVNDGTKNFQIRFYPVVTTEFPEYVP